MKRLHAVFFMLVTLAVSARGFTIVMDYTYDSTSFFSSNPTAQAALEAAATDLSNVITSSLTAISPASMSFAGTNGSTTATADWKLSFDNPTTGAATELTSFTASAGEFRIFVGARSLSGTTLGQGGPVGAGFSLGGSGFEGEWATAVSSMVAASNAVMNRGPGPTVGNFSGNATFGGSNPAYSLNYGLLAGNLWFDNDADNDGFADGDLSTYWHFNHTTAVGGGLNDFYSVALHEIGHSLGLGASLTWDDSHSGATWLGTQGIAANGTGANLVDPGSLAHIASGTMSNSIVDNAVQEALMDPSLTVGTRKYLTTLDVAFLGDLGFSVTAVPEPSTYALLAGAGALAVAALRRRRS